MSALPATACPDDGVNRAARQRTRPIESVPFHPESIGTDYGIKMIRNSLALANVNPMG
ncbi:anthranilate/para-aminobenzoate synthase component II [Pseudomonas sp. GM17]|uniref:glutamine amidotransferase-related protein n=1 Tax=Pseudomonas sp. GM17 TaxID=1144323 RepID=UPI0002722B93|nr:anthranilate/para-aminobenzoate synthase component II [Pseudomonas sp. GM17]WIE52907.1 hypothetical protein PMI20_015295 [Pseudomonas sp. GM17]